MLLKFVCFFHIICFVLIFFFYKERAVLLFVSRTLKIKLLYAAAATIATATIVVVVVVVEHPRPGRPLKLATMILIRVKV